MIEIHFFLIPQKPKQSQLSSRFDFGANNQCSFHLQYHDWGETLEQGTEPPNCSPGAAWLPTALCVFVHYCVCVCVCVCVWCVYVCSLLCVCTIQNIGHHTWPHFTFTKLVYAWLRKSFYSRVFSEGGTIQGRFC